MGQLVVMLDPAVPVAPADLAAAWDRDEEARAAGTATVETAVPGDFLGVLEIVVVPLAVNLMTNAVTALVGKLMARLRPEQPDQPDLEIAELTQANGDRVVFVRLQGKHQ
jgi:hypothetical protein